MGRSKCCAISSAIRAHYSASRLNTRSPPSGGPLWPQRVAAGLRADADEPDDGSLGRADMPDGRATDGAGRDIAGPLADDGSLELCTVSRPDRNQLLMDKSCEPLTEPESGNPPLPIAR